MNFALKILPIHKLGWAVYLVKGVMCKRDVYSILEVSITHMFLSVILTICMFLCIEQPLVFLKIPIMIHKDFSQAKRVTT